jgi:hypothetical protein
MEYLGVKRKTFDSVFRPRLRSLRVGTSVLFDRRDLDDLFDRIKEGAESGADGRPSVDSKGGNPWAVKPSASGSMPSDVSGRLTRSIEASAFDSVVKRIRKQKSG